MGDEGMPAVYNTQIRRARRQHECRDSGDRIEIGQSYEVATGLYEWGWGQYKTCLLCVAVREEAIARVENFLSYHGGLFDELDEHVVEDQDPEARGPHCAIVVSEDFGWLVRIRGNYRLVGCENAG
jgi:hypothetical protein